MEQETMALKGQSITMWQETMGCLNSWLFLFTDDSFMAKQVLVHLSPFPSLNDTFILSRNKLFFVSFCPHNHSISLLACCEGNQLLDEAIIFLPVCLSNKKSDILSSDTQSMLLYLFII